MPAYKADAIVLHRTQLGETDKILTLFTRDLGKLNAVAKGARRPTSKLSGATELFMYLRLLLGTGKNLDIVSQCEILESFSALRNDLSPLVRATYLCELTDRLIEEREPNPEVFDLLLSALYLLQRARENPDVIVHAFEMRLLAERGYAPALDHCVKCGQAPEARRLGFSPSLGGVLCSADRFATQDAIAIAPATLALLKRLGEAAPEELLATTPDPRAAREVAQCLRWYVRYRSERDLKSAEFLDRLRMTT